MKLTVEIEVKPAGSVDSTLNQIRDRLQGGGGAGGVRAGGGGGGRGGPVLGLDPVSLKSEVAAYKQEHEKAKASLAGLSPVDLKIAGQIAGSKATRMAARDLAKYIVPDETKGELAARMTSTIEYAMTRMGTQMMGMPMGAGLPIARLVSSFANPVVAGGMLAAAGGYLGYREFSKWSETQRTGGAAGALTGGSRFVGGVAGGSDLPATGSLFDILGLPGHILPWRRQMSATGSVNALSAVAPMRASDFQKGGEFENNAASFSRIVQMRGNAEKPEDVAKMIGGQMQGLTGEHRRTALPLVLAAQERAQEYAKLKVDRAPQSALDTAQERAYAAQRAADEQVSSLLRIQELRHVGEQSESVKRTGEEKRKIGASQILSANQVASEQQQLKTQTATGLGGATRFATGPRSRETFLLAKAAREQQIELSKVDEEEKKLNGVVMAASESITIVNRDYDTLFNRWRERNKPTGGIETQRQEFAEAYPVVAADKAKAELAYRKAVTEQKTFSANKGLIKEGIRGLFPDITAEIKAESAQYTNRVTSALSESGSGAIMQEIGIRSGMRGVSRVSQAQAGVTSIGIAQSENYRQIALARSRGDEVSAKQLEQQQGPLAARRTSATRDLFYEAGRPRGELLDEKTRLREELRQEGRGERRLRNQYSEEMRERNHLIGNRGSNPSFEDWSEQRRKPDQGKVGQEQDLFLSAVQSDNALSAALDKLAASVTGRVNAGPRQVVAP